jgi:hypothetical protein
MKLLQREMPLHKGTLPPQLSPQLEAQKMLQRRVKVRCETFVP